jgi:serine/threonine protein kinase/Tfp pilus assembly protein PilF
MIGQTVSHYKIIEKLGEGGMGVVYKAQDTKLDRLVALKFLPSHLSASEQDKARFVQEAKAASALNHPNVCTIHDIQEHDSQMFIVMEYVEGETLRRKFPIGNVSDAIALGIQIAEALQEAHGKGVVHRDIKAENIMVNSRDRVKVMDFGLAKLRGSLKLTRTSSTVGTLGYMAPEQIQGEDVDARSDIFSLGVVLFEMLSGRLPFRGEHEAAIMYSVLHEEPEPLAKYRNDIPAPLSQIVTRTLQKDPADRYQSAQDIVKDLKKLSTPQTVAEEKEDTSIAVLAFEDMSPQKDQDYLCEGLAEEIINALTKLDALRVSARTSAFSFKGKQLDIRDIGSKLGVQTVLEGSVRKSGNRLRITAQLINVENGYHLWSERYDRELRDVFEIQDEITDSVVRSLRLVLTDKQKKSIESVPAPNVEAFEYYLRGRRLFHRHIGKYEESIRMFSRAIEIDPQYALAYCGLSDSYAWRFMYRESSETNLLEAEKASRKAIELAPNLAEPHTSHGLAISLRKKYDDAAREFEAAIRLNPRLFEAHYYYGRMCFAKGDLVRAAKLFEEAINVRPEDYQVPGILAGIYHTLNEQTKYIATVKSTVEKSERHLELNPDDARAYYMGGGGLLLLGEVEKGEEWFARAIAIEPGNVGTHYNIACVYAQIGKIDKSIENLRNAIEHGFSHKEWVENDPDLDPLRNDSRFQELLAKMK